VSGSRISWAICKSALCSRQITTPAPHHSVFYKPDALPAAQPTASKHWRHVTKSVSEMLWHWNDMKLLMFDMCENRSKQFGTLSSNILKVIYCLKTTLIWLDVISYDHLLCQKLSKLFLRCIKVITSQTCVVFKTHIVQWCKSWSYMSACI